jgi:hypothetical protein
LLAAESEFLSEMPARIAQIAAAAQAANDALRVHIDQMAQQRSGGDQTQRDDAYQALAMALLERIRDLRGEAKELAVILERSAWHLASLGTGTDQDESQLRADSDGDALPPRSP